MSTQGQNASSDMTRGHPRGGCAFHRLPNGQLVLALPEPFSWGLLPWLWRRLTGWRDQYGRSAQFIGWRG